ncbi:MAG: hypothetical protein K1X55_06190 [Chitinophagales bacterium]|nr:hypothetical protein [Chitinophagales bacterium]
MRIYILLFFNLFLALTISAQSTDKNEEKLLEKGKQLYTEGKYSKVIEVLKPLADSGQKTALRKVADSYRMLNNAVDAEPYYAKIMEEKNPPVMYYLHYGWALMQNKKYELAKAEFLKFDQLNPDDKRGKEMALACDKSMALEKSLKDTTINSIGISNAPIKVNPNTYYFPKEKPIIANINYNSDADDFGAVFYKDGVVFSSSRSEGIQFIRKKDQVTGDAYLNVFINNDTSKNEIERIKGNVNTLLYNSGPVCFDSAQNKIYFTRNNVLQGEAGTSKKGEIKLKIYEAISDNGVFKDVKALEFNGEEFSNAYPTITPNGKRIYFTSDRAGGKGGKDIFMSEYRKGKWQKPVNVSINTAGNERFPYIHADGCLYFSSDGLPGLGGLDIYRAYPVQGDTTGTQFERIENMGKNFNTSRDDFSFIANRTYTEGYFASNREGGKGGDDIYHFFFDNCLTNIQIKNEADSTIVPFVRINFIPTSGKPSIAASTDLAGKISLRLYTDTYYQLNCLNENWEITQTNIKTGMNGSILEKELFVRLRKKVGE